MSCDHESTCVLLLWSCRCSLMTSTCPLGLSKNFYAQSKSGESITNGDNHRARVGQISRFESEKSSLTQPGRLWKTLEPQISLRCLRNWFQCVQEPLIDLQLTWFGPQTIHFGDTNDFPIFGDYLAYCLCLSPSPFWPGSYLFLFP